MNNKIKKTIIILILINSFFSQRESDKIEQKIKNENQNLNNLKEEIK